MYNLLIHKGGIILGKAVDEKNRKERRKQETGFSLIELAQCPFR
jgi:hypothetical protein